MKHSAKGHVGSKQYKPIEHCNSVWKSLRDRCMQTTTSRFTGCIHCST